jgi:hypothetical protein
MEKEVSGAEKPETGLDFRLPIASRTPARRGARLTSHPPLIIIISLNYLPLCSPFSSSPRDLL